MNLPYELHKNQIILFNFFSLSFISEIPIEVKYIPLLKKSGFPEDYAVL